MVVFCSCWTGRLLYLKSGFAISEDNQVVPQQVILHPLRVMLLKRLLHARNALNEGTL